MTIHNLILNWELSLFPLWRLRRSGAKVGKNVFIGDNFYVDLENAHLLTIKDNVTLSAFTKIVLHDSSLNNLTGGPIKFGKVTIGENSYIGLDSLILPGTEIGKNCLIGAGSLVKGKLKNNSVYVGRPAKRIGSIKEISEKWKAVKDTETVFLKTTRKWYERTD